MNFFLQRYNQLGHEFNQAEIISKLRSFQTIRANTLKIREPELIKRLAANNIQLEKIPFTDHGYAAKAKFSLGSTPEYLQGYYYLQEAASQVPVQILMPELTEKEEKINKKHGLVLDMCASPGSKTTQIAQLMRNLGVIVALDLKKEKLAALKDNIARLSIKNTIIYCMDAQHVEKLNLKFDKILLDAPCSGNFTLEKNWFEKRKQSDLRKISNKQKYLLRAALSVLKEDGTIVYSTCSLEPEEDEEVIQYALDNLGARLIPIIDAKYKAAFNSQLSGTLKFWPDITNTQGFFVAKLAKK